MSDSKTRSEFEVAQEMKALLESVSVEKREMVLRWAREAVGLPIQTVLGHAQHAPASDAMHPGGEATASQMAAPRQLNLRDFAANKAPKSDVQFAVVVAYFYRFEAPPDQQRDAISTNDLQDAARLAGRARFKAPKVPLNNAVGMGYLDRGDERGTYRINAVGENLVAMTLARNGVSASAAPARAATPRKTRRADPKTVKRPRAKKR